jgi:hypothetical protein
MEKIVQDTKDGSTQDAERRTEKMKAQTVVDTAGKVFAVCEMASGRAYHRFMARLRR